MSKWLTMACAVHCVAMPVLSLCFVGAQRLHDSPLIRLVEIVIAVIAALSALNASRNLRAHGRIAPAVTGTVIGAAAIISLALGLHAMLVCSLLLLAAFQFYAHFTLRCCHEKRVRIVRSEDRRDDLAGEPVE